MSASTYSSSSDQPMPQGGRQIVALRVGRAIAVVSLSSLSLWFGGSAARAETPPASEATPEARTATVARLNGEGVALYKAHDYRRAVEKFLQAYALEPDPNLLFNIARCYEQLDDVNAAAEKYKLYLSDPDAEPQGKRRAEEALKALQQRRGASATSAQAGRPPGGATAGNGVQTGAPERGPSRVWPMATLGAGVAVAAAGAVFYVLGARDIDKVTSSPGFGNPTQLDPMTGVAAQQLVDSGKLKKTIGVAALGVGGAALATSAVLFWLRSSDGAPGKEGEASHLSFAPALDGGGWLVLSGRF
jgi:tetratricopeptide (TPR) repeat protein